MEPVLRDWVIQLGFVSAGLGFAAIAWSLYPKRQAWQGESWAYAALRESGSWPAQAASFTCFFHFPVIMLLAALGDARWGQPLMQQPTVAACLWFALLALASVLAALLVTGALAALQRTLAGIAHPMGPKRQRRGTLP